MIVTSLRQRLGIWFELALPSELDVKRGKWSFANLPIIPDEFELKPIEKKRRPRFKPRSSD